MENKSAASAGMTKNESMRSGMNQHGHAALCEEPICQCASVDSELLEFAYRQTGYVISGTLACAWILTFVLWPELPHPDLLAWNGLLLLVSLGRHMIMKRFLDTPEEARNKISWQRRLILAAAGSSLVWGFGSLWFIQQINLSYQVFTILIIGGLAAGASSAVPAVFPVFVITMLGILSPTAIWLMLQSDKLHFAMAAAMAVFMSIVWITARQTRENLAESFTLRRRNLALVEQKERANQDLEAEIRRQKEMQETLDAVVKGTSSAIGEGFFQSLVESLSQALGVEYAFVGRLNSDTKSSVRTLAVWAGGKHADNFDYDLAGTPCENVVDKAMCAYSDSVQEQFPEDKMLVQMGVESYVGTPLFDNDGNSLGLIAILHTSRIENIHLAQSILSLFANRAEAEMVRLYHEAERYRLGMALEQVNDAIFIADDDCHFAYVNPAFQRITGYDSRSISGKPVSMLRSTRQDDTFYENMQKTLLDRRAWKGNHFMRLKDGSDIIVDRNITYIDEGPNLRPCFISIFHDITQEEEMRKQMEHAQRLESLGMLAGGIAHDFNNILTAVLGNSSLAQLKLDTSSPAREHILRIEDGARRAAELCRQMLAYAGKGQFIKAPLNLFTMVAEMSQLLEVSIAKNITIHYKLEDDRHTIMGDSAQIQQVIMNLIINASESIGEKQGEITIACGIDENPGLKMSGRLFGEPLRSCHYAYVEVADTGCGIDEATLDRIFEPFFTTKLSGRGLGMSAVLGIVRTHKGTFLISSQPGKGSSFKVLFPCMMNGNRIATSQDDQACGKWRGAGTILVIDDEESIVEVARMMLEGMGFRVLTACDGKTGIDIFTNQHAEIGAVLLDMIMPVMSGKDCLAKIKNINPDVKVILSSGYSEQDSTQSIEKQLLTGFIQKPYSVRQLRNKLMEMLN